jgi:hypothetical protein
MPTAANAIWPNEDSLPIYICLERHVFRVAVKTWIAAKLFCTTLLFPSVSYYQFTTRRNKILNGVRLGVGQRF